MSKMSIETSAGCSAKRHAFSGATMGTRYSVQCYAQANLDRQRLGADLSAAVQRVDDEMSNWKDTSDLTRLNDTAPGIWVPVSANLLRVLTRAVEIGRETDNAFNIGVGDVVGAWGFGPRRHDRPAGTQSVSGRPLPLAGDWLEFDEGKRRARKRANWAIDLCGIAKGFGVDELGRVMDRHGVHCWLAGIDGEMRAKGFKPSNAMWTIAIERPRDAHREAMAMIELTDMAVATSGDYRHWTRSGDTRACHTMDPHTGAPVAHGIASVTVLAQTCMDADAYATALMVLGEASGMRFARQKQLDALFVVREGERLRTTGTGCFAHG